MSHYAVGVVVDKPDMALVKEILAPYDENLEVEPYIERTRKEVLEECNRYINAYLTNPEGNKSYKGFADCNTVEELLDFYKDFWECEFDENGNRLSTYNPNSKWDWWCIGGRYTGDFMDNDFMKVGEYPVYNELTDEQIDNIKKRWAYYNHEIEMTDEEAEECGVCLFFRREYPVERYKTFDNYMKECTSNIPYAIVDEDGWYSKGNVGWFGCDDATTDSINDYDKFTEEYFAKKENKDKYIVIIDCHI